MNIEHYSSKYYKDCLELVTEFYEEYLSQFGSELNQKSIENTIRGFEGENNENSFLLIIDERCVGVIAGISLNDPLNEKKIFQEILWYVRSPYGKYGFWFISQVENRLKDRGFGSIVMAVLTSPKEERIKTVYQTMGYKKLETHYIKPILTNGKH